MYVTNNHGRGNIILISLATIGGLSLVFIVLTFIFMFNLVDALKGFSGDFAALSYKTKIKGDAIGVIEINDIISEVDPILKNLREFRQRSEIKAIIIRIDSPGGAVGASQELYEEIKKTDKEKPVVASMLNVAASGGYYAALGARTIIANPGTITGSIGVIMKLPNLEKLMEKIGISETVIKSGEMKDLTPISRELTDEEKKVLHESIENVHYQFVKAVSDSRKIPLENVVKIADGRIFTGSQALELKLVDSLGNFSDAIDKACELANIQGTPELVYPAKKDNIFSKFITEESSLLIRKLLSLLYSERLPHYLPKN